MVCNRLIPLFALVICVAVPGLAQKPEQAPNSSLSTLRVLVESMTALRTQLEAQNQIDRSNATEPVKEAAQKEAAAIQTRLSQAEKDFESIATGMDAQTGQTSVDLTKFDVLAELTEMVQPLLREMKAATEQPRLIEQLRGELVAQKRRLGEVQSAVANVTTALANATKGKTENPALRKALQGTLDKWRYSEKEATAAVEVVKHRLDEVLSKRKSVFEIASEATQGFFLTRGRNILFAALALVTTLFIWRWAYRWVIKMSPWHRKLNGRVSFSARVMDVLYQALSAVVATAAALAVLYSTGDWLLLGLGLIALVGLILGARTAVPKYYRHARLLLNFGEVREGERIVYQGLPWQVKSLSMFSELHNPCLRNGRLRVPLDQLAENTSRPMERDELWFPSREGDWVLLQDGTLGKSVSQTPEVVQLILLGGAHKSYPTLSYLAQNPQNLAGGFRLTTVMRLDHEHREEAATSIPQRLKTQILEGLKQELSQGKIHHVEAEFRGATTVALEFEIFADFEGDLAGHYEQLRRTLQRHALEACNEHRWKLASQVVSLETTLRN